MIPLGLAALASYFGIMAAASLLGLLLGIFEEWPWAFVLIVGFAILALSGS